MLVALSLSESEELALSKKILSFSVSSFSFSIASLVFLAFASDITYNNPAPPVIPNPNAINTLLITRCLCFENDFHECFCAGRPPPNCTSTNPGSLGWCICVPSESFEAFLSFVKRCCGLMGDIGSVVLLPLFGSVRHLLRIAYTIPAPVTPAPNAHNTPLMIVCLYFGSDPHERFFTDFLTVGIRGTKRKENVSPQHFFHTSTRTKFQSASSTVDFRALSFFPKHSLNSRYSTTIKLMYFRL